MIWYYFKEKCYVHNIFTINHKWQVISCSYKLLFCPLITTTNNLSPMICCENVVNVISLYFKISIHVLTIIVVTAIYFIFFIFGNLVVNFFIWKEAIGLQCRYKQFLHLPSLMSHRHDLRLDSDYKLAKAVLPKVYPMFIFSVIINYF